MCNNFLFILLLKGKDFTNVVITCGPIPFATFMQIKYVQTKTIVNLQMNVDVLINVNMTYMN